MSDVAQFPNSSSSHEIRLARMGFDDALPTQGSVVYRPIVDESDIIESRHSGVRLQACVDEFSSVNHTRMLIPRRRRPIEGYCQEGVVAVLPFSRSLNFCQPQARGDEVHSAAAKHDSTTGLPDGQQNAGSFVPSRDGDMSESFPITSTTGATLDAEVSRAKIDKYVPLDMAILSSAETGISQEVRDFLAKPQLISAGVFSTTDTVPVSLYSSLVPGHCLS